MTVTHPREEPEKKTLTQPPVNTSSSPTGMAHGLNNIGLSIYVRFRVWFMRTIERVKAPGGTDWILLLITATLGWLVCTYAMQVLAALVLSLVVPEGSLDASLFQPLSQFVACVSSIIAYFPLMLLPKLTATLWGKGSWWRKPTVEDDVGNTCDDSGITGTVPVVENGSDEAHEPGGSTPVRVWKWVLAAIIGAVACFVLVQVYGGIINAISGTVEGNESSSSVEGLVHGLVNGTEPLPVLIVLIMIITVFVAPFFEECLFRGVALKSILDSPFARDLNGRPTRMRTGVSILLSSLLFAVMHLPGAGGPAGGIVLTLLSITTLGCVLGSLADRYESILPSYVAHVVYNGIMMVGVLLI